MFFPDDCFFKTCGAMWVLPTECIFILVTKRLLAWLRVNLTRNHVTKRHRILSFSFFLLVAFSLSFQLTNILNHVGDSLFPHTQNTVDYSSNPQCFSSLFFFFANFSFFFLLFFFCKIFFFNFLIFSYFFIYFFSKIIFVDFTF